MKGFIHRAWTVLRIYTTKFSKIISSLILFIAVSLVAIGAYVNVVDQSLFGLLDDQWSKVITVIGSVVAVFLVFFKPLWDNIRGDGHLRNIIVSDLDKTDMKKMAYYMRSADRVLIYSGDFSYIYDHPPLTTVLMDLASADRLTFLSYKTKETVMSQSTAKRGKHECIIEKLMNRNKIHFNLPEDPKFSIVYRRGEEVLLYRHRSSNVDYVTVFKASNEMARELVNIFRMLADGVVKQSSEKASTS